MLNIKNILVLATHGSYYIPWYLKPFLKSSFKKDNYRLLKNFSDYATSYLLDDIDEKNNFTCNFSRAIWDPNRDVISNDLFRDADFNNIELWVINLPQFLKNILIKKYYNNYHSKIVSKIKFLEKKYWDVIIFDIHDTWNLLLWEKTKSNKKRDYIFPKINLWNCDDNTSTKVFMNKMTDLIYKEFWFKASLNKPYKWWFITRRYGLDYENRNVIQFEFWRYLYMNEDTQEIDFKKLKDIKKKFHKVLKQL